MLGDYVEIPILDKFNTSEYPIGFVRILKKSLPKNPNWVLTLGYSSKMKGTDEYTLLAMSIITDKDYLNFLNRTNNEKT